MARPLRIEYAGAHHHVTSREMSARRSFATTPTGRSF